MDPFKPTNNPLSVSLMANSSSRLPFGLLLPCPKSHAYCLQCITNHIISKLDPKGDGTGNPGVVFPVRCLECSLDKWPDGIPDDTAAKVLDAEYMNIWVSIDVYTSIGTLPYGFSIITGYLITPPNSTARIPNVPY